MEIIIKELHRMVIGSDGRIKISIMKPKYNLLFAGEATHVLELQTNLQLFISFLTYIHIILTSMMVLLLIAF